MNRIIARTTGSEFQAEFDEFSTLGALEMGPASSCVWRHDPRRLAIVFSRYKFVSKMLAGQGAVLEAGCGDGFFTRVVTQTVSSVHGVDYDPSFINWATEQAAREKLNALFSVSDITEGPMPNVYDAAYSLDVLEHIPDTAEDRFLGNIAQSLVEHGTCIIGTPNICAQTHASPISKAGHINLKSADTLRELMTRHFLTVFIFSMNDEVVHTGFAPMAHYLLAIGVGVRNKRAFGCASSPSV